MSFNIIVKKYEHINSSLPNWDTPKGKYIKNKHQYHDELKKANMVSFEEGCRLAEKHQKEQKWKPSKDLIDMIQCVKNTSRKGMVTLAHHPKIIEAMKKKGMSFDMSKLPKHYQDKWGD